MARARRDPHASRRSSALVAAARRDGRPRRAPDRRRAAGPARLPAARRDARRDRRARGPVADDQRLPARARRRRARRRPASTRVNVSIDSLQRDRFFQITRRDALPQVLRGLEAIAASPRRARSRSTRSRCATSPRTRSLPFAELRALDTPYQVRFIEFMPLDADRAWTPDAVLTGEEMRALIDARPPARAACRASRTPPPASTASPTARARSASSTRSPSRSAPTATASASPPRASCAPACSRCDETDLREPLRAGAADDELERIDPRRRLAQGAQAPRRRAGLPPAAAHDVRDRRLAPHSRRGSERPGLRGESAPRSGPSAG